MCVCARTDICVKSESVYSYGFMTAFVIYNSFTGFISS